MCVETVMVWLEMKQKAEIDSYFDTSNAANNAV